MSPNGGGKPSGELAAAIEKDFGSYDAFVEKFSTTAANQFGSGWGWLVKKDGKLDVVSTSNADSRLTAAVTKRRRCGLPWRRCLFMHGTVIEGTMARTPCEQSMTS